MFKCSNWGLKEHCSCQEVEEENSRIEISLPSHVKESVSRAGNNRRKMFSLPFPLQFAQQHTDRARAWPEAPELTLGHLWGCPASPSLQSWGWGCQNTEQHSVWPGGREGGLCYRGWLHYLFWGGLKGGSKGRAPSLLGRWEPSWMELADYFLFLN